MQDWVIQELTTSDLGDSRLDQRYEIVLDTLSRKPSVSIPAAFGEWKDTSSAYRFFGNDRVDENGILNPHYDAMLKRVEGQDVVLAVHDTTEIEVTRANEEMKGAGPLNDAKRLGFYNHAMLAFTPEGVPLGVIGADIYSRDKEEFLKRQEDKKSKESKRKQKPIEEKESYRWVEGYRNACKLKAECPETTVVCVGDSESDIYELFVDGVCRDKSKADWLVRACQDRCLNGEKIKSRTYPKLWNEVSDTQVLGESVIKVRANTPKSKDSRKRKQKKTSRTTTVEIRARQVELKAPYRKGKKLGDVKINAILVREKKAPKDEPPIEWMLITTLSIDTYKDICQVIHYYCIRWQIEIYFRVLKSGCNIEKRQFEYAENFKPCLALCMIISWRVMYLLMLGRKCPEMRCDGILSEEEWKSVYLIVKKQPPPATAPMLGEMVRMIAQLGGFLNRKHDGDPGPKTMWIGMQRMSDFAITWGAVQTMGGSGKA